MDDYNKTGQEQLADDQESAIAFRLREEHEDVDVKCVAGTVEREPATHAERERVVDRFPIGEIAVARHVDRLIVVLVPLVERHALAVGIVRIDGWRHVVGHEQPD